MKSSIHFGSSGGFTGAREEFILKGNGNLYKVNSATNDTSFLKKTDNKTARSIFKLAESEELLKINLNSPGNMNYFINIYNSEGLVKGFLWTDGMTIPEDLKQLNSLLANLSK